MAINTIVMTEYGIPGSEPVRSHADVEGKWGGHKAWIVHYQNFYDHDGDNQRLEIYRHIGNYYEVGSWPPHDKISKWEMVDLFVESMNEDNFGGMSIITILWMMIKYRMQRI